MKTTRTSTLQLSDISQTTRDEVPATILLYTPGANDAPPEKLMESNNTVDKPENWDEAWFSNYE